MLFMNLKMIAGIVFLKGRKNWMNYSAIWFCRKIQKFEGLAIGGIIDTNDLEKSGSVNLQTIKFSEDHVEIHKGYAPGT